MTFLDSDPKQQRNRRDQDDEILWSNSIDVSDWLKNKFAWTRKYW